MRIPRDRYTRFASILVEILRDRTPHLIVNFWSKRDMLVERLGRDRCGGNGNMADQVDDLDIPMSPEPSTAATTVMPRVADPTRPAAPKTSDQTLPPRQTDPQAQLGHNEVDARTLVIGSGISFSGDVSSCDRLVVEGTIEANLPDCENVIVAEGGVFRGGGSTQNADVRGRIEGDFVVGKRLLIRTGGHVSGTITYDEIEIEAGGKISGTIHASEKPKGLRAYATSSQKGSR